MITKVSQRSDRPFAAYIHFSRSAWENSRIASKHTLVGAFVCLLTFTGFGQTEFRLDPNQSRVQEWANEVYRDCPEYATTEYLEIYNDMLKKVSIIEVADFANRYNIENLSSMSLKNKCNPDLDYDFGDEFAPEDFNPLKYFFDFYASEDKLYRVDGTNYLITISK